MVIPIKKHLLDIESFLNGTSDNYLYFLEILSGLQKETLQNSISQQSTVHLALHKLWRDMPHEVKNNPRYEKGINQLNGFINELEANWDNLFKVKTPSDTGEGPVAKTISYSKTQVDLKPGMYYGQWTDTTVTVINRHHKPICSFQTEHKSIETDMRCSISVFPDRALVRSIGKGNGLG